MTDAKRSEHAARATEPLKRHGDKLRSDPAQDPPPDEGAARPRGAQPAAEPRKQHGDALRADPDRTADDGVTDREAGGRQRQQAPDQDAAQGADDLGFPPDDESQWG